MNDKRAKRIRKEMRRRLREPQQRAYDDAYAEGFEGVLIWRHDVLDWIWRDGYEIYNKPIKVLVYRRLRQGCGRHIYKLSKERVRVQANQSAG